MNLILRLRQFCVDQIQGLWSADSALFARRGRRWKAAWRDPYAVCAAVQGLESRTLLVTFTVTSLNDAGAGSLRQAVADANTTSGTDTIDLSGLTGTIALTSGPLELTDSVIITGPGADQLTISGNDSGRVLQLGTFGGGRSYQIRDLTIAHGNAGSGEGGGIRMIDAGDQLRLERTTLRDNRAESGGALQLVGQFHISDSAIVNNAADLGGSAIQISGNSADGWITNTTISSNSSASNQAAIAQYAADGQTLYTRLRNVTIASSTGAGAEQFAFTGGTTTLEIANTLFAQNSTASLSSGSTGIGSAAVISNGNNLADDPALLLNNATDRINTNAQIGPLAANGGSTLTHALLTGSPAIDGGNNALATAAGGLPFINDQRQGPFRRIHDGDGDSVATIDIGAFEAYGELLVSSITDIQDNDHTVGQLTLREALAVANATPGADEIRFAPSLSGSITVTSELVISDDINIVGPGAILLTISGGNGAYRVFHVSDNTPNLIDVAISRLTISDGGNGTAPLAGAGILSRENLTLDNVLLTNNNASSGVEISGGALFHTNGRLTVTSSTVSGNRAASGGGVYIANARADFRNSLLSANTSASGSSTQLLNAGGGITTFSNVTVDDQTNGSDSIATTAGAGELSELYVTNSTFAGTSATAIVAVATSSGNASATYGNSIFSGYSNGVNSGGSGTTALNSSGFNIFQIAPSGNTVATDLVNVDPLIGPLQDNGGVTRTRELLSGSPAIDAGDNALAADLSDLTSQTPLITDQRGTGFVRLLDGNGSGVATVDIGAFERQADFMVVSPTGRIINPRPVISWTPVIGALSYDVWLNIDNGGGNVVRQLGLPANQTSYQVEVDLQFAVYRVFVIANFAGGSQQTAAGHTFIVDQQAVLNSIGAISGTNPVFTWSRVPGAASYVIFVNRPGSPVIETVGDPGAGALVSHSLTASLPPNDYKWWVRPVRDNGWQGPWSRESEFSTGGKTRITSPIANSIITTSIPTLTWPAVSGAESYEVFVSREGTPGAVYRDAGITGNSIGMRLLENGRYTVYIRTTLDDGSQIWGSGVSFEMNAAAIALQTVPNEPFTPGFATQPEFTWQSTAGATSYDIYLHSGTSSILQTALSGTAWTPATALAADEWTWSIRPVSSAGTGQWSSPMAFTTNGRTSLLSPSASTTDATPTFIWQSVGRAISYALQVNSLSTGVVIRQDGLLNPVFTPTTPLPPGSYRAWVRAVSSSTTGPWSIPYDFVIGSS